MRAVVFAKSSSMTKSAAIDPPDPQADASGTARGEITRFAQKLRRPYPLPRRNERVTPMMAQYIEIKARQSGFAAVFTGWGISTSFFFEDAEIASRALGIVLTKRGKHRGEDIPMCGVPVERADDYLQRLIGLGHRVAVCEQMEDPAEAKETRGQIRGTPRCRAPRHAGHDHRGESAGARARQPALWR